MSYISILRNNRNFRLLYIGQTISQLGDWFNAVAVYALLLDLTGSATAVAWMMIVQFLPVAIFGPLAGVIVDRVNRRRLMIATDLLRGVPDPGAAVHPPPGSGVDRLRRDGVRGRRAGVLRAGANGDDSERDRAGGSAAGQRAVERDLVGDAGARRVDRRHGDRGRRPQRRVRGQRAVVLRVGASSSRRRATTRRRPRRRRPTGMPGADRDRRSDRRRPLRPAAHRTSRR